MVACSGGCARYPPVLRPGVAYIAPMPCSHLPPTDLPDPLQVEETHLTETVLLLARGIATDLGFDRLPILADALEDAGCDNFALLNHLRSNEPHRVECWALRRLLRTTLMLPGDVPMVFAYCAPGTFMMGSDHPQAEEDERPVRPVSLTAGFNLVTQEQWRAVMGTDPSHFEGKTLPVESMTWEEAREYCERVRKLAGQQVRLPSETEWEYAARGGTGTQYYWGTELDGTQANCDGGNIEGVIGMPGSFREATTFVGYFANEYPHPWGLTDVIGNVWELCADYLERDYSVVCRGGAWDSDPFLCRVSYRHGVGPRARNDNTGFRVVFTAT